MYIRRKTNVKRNLLSQRGLTLIEIMVVVVILSILAAAIVPRIMDKPDEVRVQQAKTDIKAIETALKLYKLQNGSYPGTEQGLQALVEPPTTGNVPKNWKPYLDKLPKDPWGNEYIYLCPGVHGDFDITSYGADGAPEGEGFNADIHNWED